MPQWREAVHMRLSEVVPHHRACMPVVYNDVALLGTVLSDSKQEQMKAL